MSQDRTKKNRLGKTYALALYEFASNKKQLDATLTDLEGLNAAYQTSEQLTAVTTSPLVSKTELIATVNDLQKKLKFSSDFQKFCHLLAENRRLGLIPEITHAFKTHLANERGEQSIVIKSAEPLAKATLTKITKLVDDHSGKKSTVETAVDETLLGGFVVEIGSKMIDASLANQLHQLQTSLKSINT